MIDTEDYWICAVGDHGHHNGQWCEWCGVPLCEEHMPTHPCHPRPWGDYQVEVVRRWVDKTRGVEFHGTDSKDTSPGNVELSGRD